MEYEIVRGNRLTKRGKIFFGVAILLILLITTILILSKENFFVAYEREEHKLAKEQGKDEGKKQKSKQVANIFPQIGNKETATNTKKNNVQEVYVVEIREVQTEELQVEQTETNSYMKIYTETQSENYNITENSEIQEEENVNTEENKAQDENQDEGVRNIQNFIGKPLVAFTFDDGPNSETTNRLLDNLDQYNARVTFFVVGSRVGNNAETLKRAYDMGNQIGNHTYNHKNLFKLDCTQVLEEIQSTNNAVKEIIGVEPTLIRPPFGNINKEIKSNIDMYTILWDLDTEDWKNRNPDMIVDYVLNNVHDGAIVLFHDIYDTSVDGALRTMELLKQQGYEFVTIDEMVKLKEVELNKETNYHYFY